jgi:23S rRNA (cytosine1962-C5)-methyltransferase
LYDAVILDPPTFGRSPEGKVWKFERDLSALLGACEKLLVPEPLFLLLSAHTPGVSAGVLRNLLSPLHQRRGGRFESGDMLQRCAESPLLVPAGVFCRWTPTS